MSWPGRWPTTAAAAALASTLVALAAVPAVAAPSKANSFPSDPRATFHSGNVTTCAGVGLASDVQLSASDMSASDASITGTVSPNTGTVQPGQGQELDVAIKLGASVQIDAVVVKGGNGYNVYSKASVLPPTLLPPQHYISPLNGGHNVPDISHWLVCYRLSTPPKEGTLTLFKMVIPPVGESSGQLPTSFTAQVNCNDSNPGHHDVVVTFGAGGGEGTPKLTGLAPGTVCTVTELNTGPLPPGTIVSYQPPAAHNPGVTIGGGGVGVEVTIVNNFSQAVVRHGKILLEKVVRNPAGAPGPAHFTARVTCNDGTNVVVTLPGHGGLGTPLVRPEVGSDCTVREVSVPAGWTVTYSVNGGPASAKPSAFHVTSATATVTVTITDKSPSPTPAPTQPVPTPSGPPVTGTATASSSLSVLLLVSGIVLAMAGFATGAAAAPWRRGHCEDRR